MSSGVRTDGTPVKFTFTANYDGKEYPVTGNSAWDTISLKQIDANNVTVVLTKKGTKYHMTDRLVVSPDARTLTLTRNGTDTDGKAVKDRTVAYEKQ
jgi:hypothetical protein